jgi:hypothetical protein
VRFLAGRWNPGICTDSVAEYNLDSQHSDKGDRKAPNLAIMLKVLPDPNLSFYPID